MINNALGQPEPSNMNTNSTNNFTSLNFLNYNKQHQQGNLNINNLIIFTCNGKVNGLYLTGSKSKTGSIIKAVLEDMSATTN